MQLSSLTFVTSNPDKVEQLARYLDYPVLCRELDLPEIQSLDLKEIVEHKAREAYRQIQKPVLVEDVSLIFTALGKLPGPLVKWFLKEIGTDGLAELLPANKDRSALAQICVGLYDGHDLHMFEGEKKGSVANSPRGELSFGWSPIFIPEGHEKTWSEMNIEEQRETSMRRIALEKLGAFLKLSA